MGAEYQIRRAEVARIGRLIAWAAEIGDPGDPYVSQANDPWGRPAVRLCWSVDWRTVEVFYAPAVDVLSIRSTHRDVVHKPHLVQTWRRWLDEVRHALWWCYAREQEVGYAWE